MLTDVMKTLKDFLVSFRTNENKAFLYFRLFLQLELGCLALLVSMPSRQQSDHCAIFAMLSSCPYLVEELLPYHDFVAQVHCTFELYPACEVRALQLILGFFIHKSM